VIVLLEWTTANDDIIHTKYALHKAINDLQMTWATQQCNISEVHQKMPITDAEVTVGFILFFVSILFHMLLYNT